MCKELQEKDMESKVSSVFHRVKSHILLLFFV